MSFANFITKYQHPFTVVECCSVLHMMEPRYTILLYTLKIKGGNTVKKQAMYRNETLRIDLYSHRGALN